MDVSIIIVNFNTCELTLKCIESIYSFTKQNSFEIILVDNNSSDNSVEMISRRFPEVKLIVNEENIGFGRGNNKGNKIAKGEFVFLLNSDAYLISDAIHVFFEFMKDHKNSKVAVVGGELLSGQDFETVSYGNLPSVMEYFSYLGFKHIYKNYFIQKLASGIVNKDSTHKVVGYVNGADMFIRKEIFDRLGGFDEEFFLYFEETELSYRVRKLGYVSMVIPEVTIIHLVSFYRDTFSKYNYDKLKIYSKSRFLYFKKTSGYTASIFTNIIASLLFVIQGVIGKDKDSFLRKAWISLTTFS
jgi:GT2 family glycosyltransferase